MLVDTIIQYLNAALSDLPIGFTDTFEYTKTGKNWTHPLILGHLVKAAWEVEYVSQVGIDVRLNDTKGTKFQPDLVGLNKKLKPIFAIDYESTKILQTVEFQPKTSVHIQHGGKQPAIAFHTSLSQLYQRAKNHRGGNFGMYPKKDTIRVLKIMNLK